MDIDGPNPSIQASLTTEEGQGQHLRDSEPGCLSDRKAKGNK